MNSEPTDNLKDELSRLVGCACDGVLAEEQRMRLNELLANSAALRIHYLRYIAIHSALTTTAGSQATRGVEELRDRLTTSVHLRKRPGTGYAGWNRVGGTLLRAAAILFVLLPPAYFAGKWVTKLSQQAALPEVVAKPAVIVDDPDGNAMLAAGQGKARVIRVSPEILWPHPNESYTVDSIIRSGGRLRFLEGEIELVYESGAKLLLIGPVDFVLQDIGGDLHRGGLMASVPQAGHGFTIATPNGKVVDLGTEFGVMVDDFGVSEVSVFEGKVEAFPTSSSIPSEGKIRLTKGSALQWNNEMLKSLEADPRRLPITLASYAQPNFEQLASDVSLSDDFRSGRLDSQYWLALGEVRPVEDGLVLQGKADASQIPYLVTKNQYDPTFGPVTVICDVRFPHITSSDVPSFSILTRSTADRTAMDRAWQDMLSTCVRCNFRSATDEVDGLLEASTKYERDRELTSLSWRGFRRPQQNVPYRLVMRDDGVNVSFSVTQIDKPSVTKTVVCRSLFQGYENHIALEGWNRGTVIVDKMQVYQEPTDDRLADHSRRFAFASEGRSLQRTRGIVNPLHAQVPANATLVVEDQFEEPTLNARHWSVLGDVDIVDGKVSLGPSRADNHIDTFHPRPYLLTRSKFVPADARLYVLGEIEFDDNFLQGYGGSFAIMSRCENRYADGPEWAVSALSTGIRCNLWPSAPQADHNLEIHEKPSPAKLTFLKGSTLGINPRSRSYYFLMEDSGNEATITFQDATDPAIVGVVSHETSADAPQGGQIGFESTWGSRVLLDNVRVYVLEPESSER